MGAGLGDSLGEEGATDGLSGSSEGTHAGVLVLVQEESGRGGCLMAFRSLSRAHPDWLRARLAAQPELTSRENWARLYGI